MLIMIKTAASFTGNVMYKIKIKSPFNSILSAYRASVMTKWKYEAPGVCGLQD